MANAWPLGLLGWPCCTAPCWPCGSVASNPSILLVGAADLAGDKYDGLRMGLGTETVNGGWEAVSVMLSGDGSRMAQVY